MRRLYGSIRRIIHQPEVCSTGGREDFVPATIVPWKQTQPVGVAHRNGLYPSEQYPTSCSQWILCHIAAGTSVFYYRRYLQQRPHRAGLRTSLADISVRRIHTSNSQRPTDSVPNNALHIGIIPLGRRYWRARRHWRIGSRLLRFRLGNIRRSA
jgi:hypothetical protein